MKNFESNNELKQKKARIMKYIINKVKDSGHKKVKIIYLTEDDEYIDESEITLAQKKTLDKDYTLMRKVIPPYVMMCKKKDVIESYLENLTMTERGYILSLMYKIDITGKVRYGDNVQQYCRTYQDLAKALGVSYNTIKQNLIPKLKDNDIIRTVTISKSAYKTTYISFNPILIVSGGYWDRWEVIIWFDELMKHELLTLEEVKSITGLTEDEILNEREKYTKRK